MADDKRGGFFARMLARFTGADKPKRAQLVASPGSWLSSDGYNGQGNAQWDPNGPPVELPIYGVPPPNLVRAVNAAISQLEQGAFYAAAYLWDGMLRDDRVAATLNVRISGTVGAPLDLDPGKDTARARKVKEDIEKRIGRMAPSHQVAQLLRNGIGLSVGIAQIVADRNGDPTIRVWSNRNLRYDWVLRCYRLVTENRGEITIDYGDPEWIIYEPYGPLGWLHGAVIRSIAQPWLIRYWTRTWWARYQEVHGQPIRVGILPPNREPADEKVFLKQLSNLAHEASIRLVQGEDGNKFDVKMLEASDGNWRGFLELLHHCDESIEISLLGQSQSTEGQGGLGTNEKAGESTMLRILRADSLVGEAIRDQFLRPWVEWNYGDADLAPYLHWQIEPPEDLAKKSASLLNIAKAVQTFALAPQYARHVDVRVLLEELGLPLVAEDQVPPDVPNVPTSPPADTEDPNEDDDEQPPKPPAAKPTAPAGADDDAAAGDGA